MYNFNAKEMKDAIVQWIQYWFASNGKGCKAVVGISGGIDSSTVAALCVEALGKDSVVGVLLPQNTQSDIGHSYMLCEHLGIKHYVIDMGTTVNGLLNIIKCRGDFDISEQTEINLPPRIRMATLYAVSQSVKGRVANTSNLSESWVGYDTRYGDSVGDFAPLANLTKTEIRLIAKELGLPEELVNKTPADGLCGLTDEDRFGFTYKVLDNYIRTGICKDDATKAKIDAMHKKNYFKLLPMPAFNLLELSVVDKTVL